MEYIVLILLIVWVATYYLQEHKRLGKYATYVNLINGRRCKLLHSAIRIDKCSELQSWNIQYLGDSFVVNVSNDYLKKHFITLKEYESRKKG